MYRVSIDQFAKVIGSLGTDLGKAALRGARSASHALEAMVTEEIGQPSEGCPHPPIDTGELMRSVGMMPTRTGAVVFVNAPHAPFMEYGTRPHFPPIRPLAEWAYRKGLADSEEEAEAIALNIARTIARWGQNPRHFMQRAVRRFVRSGILQREIKHELRAIRRRR